VVASETNLEQFREVTPAGRLKLENSTMLNVSLEGDQIQAKVGSMVAYQGEVRCEYQSGGLGRFFKKALTDEGVKLMTAAGTGDLFLAHDKRMIMILVLDNEWVGPATASWLSSRASAGTSTGSRARTGSPAASSTWSSRGRQGRRHLRR